jgi:hypothetical protein
VTVRKVGLNIPDPVHEPPLEDPEESYTWDVFGELLWRLAKASEGASRIRAPMKDVEQYLNWEAFGHDASTDSPRFWLGTGEEDSGLLPRNSGWKVESVDWEAHEITFRRVERATPKGIKK